MNGTIQEKLEGLSSTIQSLCDAAVKNTFRQFTEVCPHCGKATILAWDEEIEKGYEIYCPYCGEKMMLCSICPHRDECNFDDCKIKKEPEPEDILKDFWFEKGDTYFEIDRDNDIDENTVDIEWTPGKGQFTAYHTEEFAKLAQNVRRFYDKLLAFKWCYDRDYKPDFDDDDEKYRIAFDHETNRYIYLIVKHFDNGFVHFSTKEIAQKCCDWLNSEVKYD